MHPIQRIKTIARAAVNPVRAMTLAGALLITGGAGAVINGAQPAGATGNGGYHPTTTTSVPDDCFSGNEADPCETTTTVAPTTTSTTTSTTIAPTTTTEPPTTTTSTTIPQNCGTCDDFNQILLAGTDPDPFNNYWNAIHEFAREFHLDYDWAVHYIQDECGQHPPIEPTTTTTMPTTTTTSTTIPPTTTTSTTVPPTTTSTTVPPTTSTTSTTVAPTTTSTTLLLPTSSTTIAPAAPATPVTAAPAAPTGTLARTGAETDVLTLIGGTGVATGTGLVVAAARVKSKGRNVADKLKGKEVAAGGPNPDPLTPAEIDEFDVDALIADIEAKDANPIVSTGKFSEGNNREETMRGYNVPDALLPAALRRNPNQTAPSNFLEGMSKLSIPGRLFERGIEL